VKKHEEIGDENNPEGGTKEEKGRETTQKNDDVDMEVDKDPIYEDYEEEIDWAKSLEKAIKYFIK